MKTGRNEHWRGASRALQLFFNLLRERVGSPLKVSSLAQALQISPTTAARYIEILEALYIVFRVTPWHRDVARSLLKESKIYFLDTGLAYRPCQYPGSLL